MPVPLTETERHLAGKIGERLQKESQNDIREEIGQKPMPGQEKLPSLTEKVIQFINDITTPKGT